MKRNLPIPIDEGDYVEGRDFARLEVGEQGQVVIPIKMLEAIGFQPGQKIVVSNKEGRLLIETQEQIKQKIQGMLAHLPKDRSLADELIQERREAARREAEKG